MQIQHLLIPEQACLVKGSGLPPSSRPGRGGPARLTQPCGTPTGQAEAAGRLPMGSSETGSRAVTRKDGLQPAALLLRVLKATQYAQCALFSNFQKNN